MIKKRINKESTVLYLMIIQVNMADLIVQVLQEEEEAVEEEDNKYWYRDTFVDQLEVLEQDPINQR